MMESDDEYVDSQDWLSKISHLEEVNKQKSEEIKSKDEIIDMQKRDTCMIETKLKELERVVKVHEK